MTSQLDPATGREYVYNRWGEEIGIFHLRNGYWAFVMNGYRKDPTLTPAELQWLEKKEMELNI